MNLINLICVHEESNFLPIDLSKIVLKLLVIRKETFRTQRYSEDYYEYKESGVFFEHPLAFYPSHPLISYPKKYVISNSVDEEICSKSYPSHSDFSGGLFTIGCSCELSITFGFEVTIGAECHRIPFKFLMNRKIDWQNLEGFIYDNCCNLHRYFLNREAKKVENMRFLVDGCHFQGQKKFKKRNEKTGSDGHLGCSESYNFMQYKKFTSVHKDGAKNSQGKDGTTLNFCEKFSVVCKISLLLCYFLNLSLQMCKKREDLQKLRVLPSLLQGREQMHAILKPLAKSLRQMNYFNFFRTLIMFFSVRNLIVMDKI